MTTSVFFQAVDLRGNSADKSAYGACKEAWVAALQDAETGTPHERAGKWAVPSVWPQEWLQHNSASNGGFRCEIGVECGV